MDCYAVNRLVQELFSTPGNLALLQEDRSALYDRYGLHAKQRAALDAGDRNALDRLLVARKSGHSSASIQYQLNLDRSIKQRHETMADVSQPRSSRCRSLRFAAASWRVGFLDSSTADASVGTFVRGGLPRRPNSFQERALRTRMSRNGELVSEEGGDGFESDISKPENVAFTMGCAHA